MNCFAIAVAISRLRVRVLDEKVMGGLGSVTFCIKGLKHTPHL